jgi:hypothetical protein
MLLGDLLKAQGINITPSMTWIELAAAWALVPTDIKEKYPAITTALTTLAATAAALTLARTVYETAHGAMKTATTTYNSALRLVSAPGPGAALEGAEQTSNGLGSASATSDTALQASTDSIKTTILTTEVS